MFSEPIRRPRKGRGAVSNPSGRFEPYGTVGIDDGWQLGGDERVEPLPTRTTIEHPKSIISRNTSPDIPFDRTVNPYRGCEHGCVYCFARPSHAYMGLSPGLDFETKLFAKPDAPALLRAALRKPGYTAKPLQLGANTDPYQPIERHHRITRRILRVLLEFGHPVAVTTKSGLVCRDTDILAEMAAAGLAAVAVSVTTLEPKLARTLEPRAPRPDLRLAAIGRLADAGIPVCVLVAPVLPALNDHELERILEAARDAGAVAASYTLLRLPHELKHLFSEWLETHVPDRARHVLNQLRESRNGDLYVSDFATRMRGTGPTAELLDQRFRLAVRRLGFRRAMAAAMGLRTDLFRPPEEAGTQLSLL